MHHASAYFPLAGAVPFMWAGSRNPFSILASQGWLAVGLFLIISGYSLGRGLQGKEISWRGYLGARWLRVAPLYLTLLVLGTLAVGVTPPPAEYFAALTLLPIPGAYSPGAWMGVTWSVRIEVLLYLTIPALVMLAKTLTIKRIASMGVALVFTMFLLLKLNGASSENILYWGAPGRLLEFSVGFFLGYFGYPLTLLAKGRFFGGIAAVGYVLTALVLNRLGGFNEIAGGIRFLVYILGLMFACMMLAWASDPRPPRIGRIDSVGRALGSWSYSTYMWHVVIITLVIVPLWTRLGAFGWNTTLVLGMGIAAFIALTAFVSWLSFSMIEAPFLALRPRYLRSPVDDGAVQ